MDAIAQDLPFDAATLRGLSDKLLASHHRNNYGGAVKRLNAIRAELAGTSFAGVREYRLNGLKREELIATVHGHEVSRAAAMRLRARWYERATWRAASKAGRLPAARSPRSPWEAGRDAPLRRRPHRQ
ncbi:MAG: hypothetical protein U1F67_23290 [Rubrivivax sp.]